ncbi:MAG: hypothetical protein MUE42_15715 [Opitutaceae bacterium]|nr:hypothetical protein [Opitutaceae bacterium]
MNATLPPPASSKKSAAPRDPSRPLSTNKPLLKWVEKIAALTRPDAIHWNRWSPPAPSPGWIR